MGTQTEIKTSLVHRSRRELVTLVVLMLGFLAASVAGSVAYSKKARRDFFSTGQGICTQMAEESQEPLLALDELRLNDITDHVMQNPSAVYAVLTDHDGLVRAHSDLKKLGTVYRPPTDTRPVEGAEKGEVSMREHTGLDGSRIVEFTAPVRYSGLRIGQVYVGLKFDPVLSRSRRVRWGLAAANLLLLGIGVAALLLLDRRKKRLEGERAKAMSLGPYRLLEKIGEGGMAEIFRGKRLGVEGFEKTVAIKRILPHLSNDARFQKMFLKEARNGAKLDHPNIVQIFDVGNFEGIYFIAMEFIDGRTLAEILRRLGRPVDLPMALYVAVSVARGLAYAHKYISAHRDITPQNVLVSMQGEVKISDFGIAKALEDDSGRTRTAGIVMGKLAYMAPEQAMGSPVDHRTDIFAFGALLFEMLSGRRLFSAENEAGILAAVLKMEKPDVREACPELPEAMATVLEKALEPKPEARYPSAAEMCADLEALAASVEPFTSTHMARFMEDLFGAAAAGPRREDAPA